MMKPQPPNAFSWYARYIADERRNAGRPFRSTKAAIQEAATLWGELSPDEKNDWKEKARTEKARFRSDPDLRTMTRNEFIAQACEISTNGMVGDSRFWSRHWAEDDRREHFEELDQLNKFDTEKRMADRDVIKDAWIWKFGDNRDDLLRQHFLFISVQSSSPVESDSYVPETLAIAQFSVQEGIVQYTEFCCSLALDDARRSGGGENFIGDKDGCQTRVGLQTVAKLVFQRLNEVSKLPPAPILFCLADEYEMVYDALCDLQVRAFAKNQTDTRRFSIKQLATFEDLAYCLLQWQEVVLPSVIANRQGQMYFDNLMERTDQRLVATMRCGAHSRDSVDRCPLSVVRLVAWKIKEWLANKCIPEQDVPLLERSPMHQCEWPLLPDQVAGFQGSGDSDDDQAEHGIFGATQPPGLRLPKSASGAKYVIDKMEMTAAWVSSQAVPEKSPSCAGTSAIHGSEGAGICNDASTTSAAPEVQQSNDSGKMIQAVAAVGQCYSQGSHASASSRSVATHSVHGKPHQHVTGGRLGRGRSIRPQPICPPGADHSANDGSDTARAENVQNGNSEQMDRLKKIITAGHRLVGVGTELEYSHLLPIGSRGIGRGLHLVPKYDQDFKAFKEFLR